ncbi:MAG: thiol-disulfide isomerase/thioredoxin [Sphingobacteriales bacterium]|jgi:thiol-disulfide isomerase/thioredoxin
MKKLIFILGIFLLTACSTQDYPMVEVVNFDQMENYYSQESDVLYVVNFWATWCKPCVSEMPLFDALSRKENPKVKVIMVSLDFPEELDETVGPFLKEKNIHPQTLLLDAGNPNVWIDRVSPEWGGAIPGTLFIRASDNTRIFVEDEFEKGELSKQVNEILNKN